jgi:hypothetical protein
MSRKDKIAILKGMQQERLVHSVRIFRKNKSTGLYYHRGEPEKLFTEEEFFNRPSMKIISRKK